MSLRLENILNFLTLLLQVKTDYSFFLISIYIIKLLYLYSHLSTLFFYLYIYLSLIISIYLMTWCFCKRFSHFHHFNFRLPFFPVWHLFINTSIVFRSVNFKTFACIFFLSCNLHPQPLNYNCWTYFKYKISLKNDKWIST